MSLGPAGVARRGSTGRAGWHGDLRRGPRLLQMPWDHFIRRSSVWIRTIIWSCADVEGQCCLGSSKTVRDAMARPSVARLSDLTPSGLRSDLGRSDDSGTRASARHPGDSGRNALEFDGRPDHHDTGVDGRAKERTAARTPLRQLWRGPANRGDQLRCHAGRLGL